MGGAQSCLIVMGVGGKKTLSATPSTFTHLHCANTLRCIGNSIKLVGNVATLPYLQEHVYPTSTYKELVKVYQSQDHLYRKLSPHGGTVDRKREKLCQVLVDS